MTAKRSPEKERSAQRRQQKLGVALRANLRRRKAADRDSVEEQPSTQPPCFLVATEPADEPTQ